MTARSMVAREALLISVDKRTTGKKDLFNRRIPASDDQSVAAWNAIV